MKMFNSCQLYKGAPPAMYTESCIKLLMKQNCNKVMPLQPFTIMELSHRTLSEIFSEEIL